MGMEFAPNWLRRVSPLLHKTTLTTVCSAGTYCIKDLDSDLKLVDLDLAVAGLNTSLLYNAIIAFSLKSES